MKIAHISDLHFLSGKALLKNLATTAATSAAIFPLITSGNKYGKVVGGLGMSLVLWRSRLLACQLERFTNSLEASRDALLADLKVQRPDQVIITGDLTTVGDKLEFEQACDYLLKIELICGEGNITVIPGNHDVSNTLRDKVLFTETRVKLARYLKYFKRFLICEDGVYFPFSKTIGEIFLVGLDSTGPDLALAGSVSNEQLDRTFELFQSAPGRDSFKILLLHHHLKRRSVALLPQRLTEYFFDLRNSHEVEQLIHECGVQSVFHGHVHEMYNIVSPVRQECAGATLYPYGADDERQISYCIYQWANGVLTKERRLLPVIGKGKRLWKRS